MMDHGLLSVVYCLIHVNVCVERFGSGVGAGFGEFDREAGRSGDGRNDWNPAGKRFLQNLKGGAAAYHEDMRAQRKQFVQQSVAEDFIDGVVPANVFAQREEFAAEREQAGGMEPTGEMKSGLCLAQAVGQLQQNLCRDTCGFGNGREMLVHRFDAGLAAKAAAGRHEHMPFEPSEVELHVGSEV